MPILVPPDPTDAAVVRQFLGQHLRLLRAATPQDCRRDMEMAQMVGGAFPAVQTAPILDAIAIVDRVVAGVQKSATTCLATWLYPSVLDHMRREHGLWASLLQGGLDLGALAAAAGMHGRDVALIAGKMLDPALPPTMVDLETSLRNSAEAFQQNVLVPGLDPVTAAQRADRGLQMLADGMHSANYLGAPRIMAAWGNAHEEAENSALMTWLRRGLARQPLTGGIEGNGTSA